MVYSEKNSKQIRLKDWSASVEYMVRGTYLDVELLLHDSRILLNYTVHLYVCIVHIAISIGEIILFIE